MTIMKLNKFFIAIGLAVATMSLQSCLKDQEDFFDETSSERLQAVLEHAKTVLTSSENGWAFDYYPDRDLSYGGFVYILKFDDQKVSVRSEIAPSMEETSLYKLNTNNGPVLSFDSYNTLMHYFATPSNGAYEAMDGDFEFMIMDVTDDLIKVRGIRTGNTMYLHRLTEAPDVALAKTVEMADNMYYPEFEGTAGSETVSAAVNNSDRTMTFTWAGGESEGNYFVPTTTGIRFLNPVEINGATVSELTFDTASSQLTGTASDGSAITMTGKLPATYSLIDEFEGSFTFSYAGGAKNVKCTLVPDKDAGTITIKGLNSRYDLIATYNKSYGCMELCGQVVGATSDSQILFVPGTTSGFYTQNGVGFLFIKNPDDPTSFEIALNDHQLSVGASNSFVLVEATADGYYLAPTAYRINGDYAIANIKAFIKN